MRQNRCIETDCRRPQQSQAICANRLSRSRVKLRRGPPPARCPACAHDTHPALPAGCGRPVADTCTKTQAKGEQKACASEEIAYNAPKYVRTSGPKGQTIAKTEPKRNRTRSSPAGRCSRRRGRGASGPPRAWNRHLSKKLQKSQATLRIACGLTGSQGRTR